MKKILFGITSLTLGGAERVLVDLANELCNQYDITIATIYAKGELESQLSKKVKLKSFYDRSYSELSKIQKKWIMPLKILLGKNRIYQHKIKGDYDVEIAFLEGPITRLFSVQNKKTKKIAWIHNDISLVFGKGLKARLKKQMDQKIYQKYQNLVFVSQDNQDKFEKVYSLKNEKEVIYNYINADEVVKKAEEKEVTEFKPNEVNIVTVARLVKQKAIDRLIEVHSRLMKEGIKHNLYVIGDGPEREKLEKLIQENKVEDSFILLGKKENPYPYIKGADYFVLLSYYEGYPMVLLEAQILKKYVVITNTAARETLQNYKDCMIVENEKDSIYQGLKDRIQNKKVQKVETNNQKVQKDILKQIINLIER